MNSKRFVFRGIDPTPELLSAQGRSLRGLARSLLGDPHAADDVVQETWLAYLDQSSRIRGRVSAWLSSVARNLARRHVRGEARRRGREERAAAAERIEAAQQAALLREETLRAVTAALLALEEPYRGTLILRFFEERSPLEIARELDLPPTTVKSRIARGLEQLRAKLAAQHEGEGERWLRGLAALSGWKLGAGAGGASTAAGIGALIMSVKLELACASLAVACAFVCLWPQVPRDNSAGETPAVVGGAAITSVGGALVPAAQRLASAAGREALSSEEPALANDATPQASALVLEASFPFGITGRVRDERDQPLPRARILLGPRGLPLNRVAETDDEGRFVVRFHARTSELDLALAIEADGERHLGLRALRAVAGTDLALDLSLRRDLRVREGLALSLESTRREAGEYEITYSLAPDMGARVHADPFERAPEFERTSGDWGYFVDPVPDVRCSGREEVELLEIDGVFIDSVERRIVTDLSFQVRSFSVSHDTPASSDSPEAVALVRGVVSDAHGAPVPGAEVGWGRGNEPTSASAFSDESGAYELAGVPAETEITLRAGGGDLGLAGERLTLRAGELLAWNPLLARGEEITGRLLASDGKPLAHVGVELWAASASSVWSDTTLTDENGRFALPNVPRGSFDLFVLPASQAGLPVRIVRRVQGGDELGELCLLAEELAHGSFSIAVEDAQQERAFGAELRLWHEDSGRGLCTWQPAEDGRLVLAGLPAGRYRVEVSCELGRRELGSVWIGAGENVEHAPASFEPSAAQVAHDATCPACHGAR